jgi:RNA polymerase sigma factor (TIGR02999 family)
MAGTGDRRNDAGADLSGSGGELVSLLYDELRRIARRLLRGTDDVLTLQPTALVNEAMLRLMSGRTATPTERTHFLALHAKVMRQVIIDEVRRARAGKRRHLRVDTSWIDSEAATPGPLDLERLDAALDELERISAERAQVVELRFYVGLTTAEIGEIMGTSERTVKRWWQAARAWLLAEMERTVGD